MAETKVTTEQVKQQAQAVGSDAASRAGEVVSDAGDQAKAVTDQARDELRRVWEQSRSEVGEQAQQRSQHVADSLHTFADRLGSLVAGDTEQAGPLLDYLRDGRQRVAGLADRLEEGPDAVLEDVRTFARQKPLMFLACAGGLGFLTGRLVRAGSSDAGSTESSEPQSAVSPMDPAVSVSTTPSSSADAQVGTGTPLPADQPPEVER